MKINWFKKNNIRVENIQRETDPKKINDRLVESIVDRVQEYVKDYAQAIQDWENPLLEECNRYTALLNLYKNMELDDHVKACKEIIINSIIQTPFGIYAGETKDEAKSELFKKEWFTQFILSVVESELMQFSVINILPIENGYPKGVESIKRYNVRFEQNGISFDDRLNRINISWLDAPYNNTILPIRSNDEFGKFSAIAKKFIFKRSCMEFWATYNELFTTPNLAIKTDNNDKIKQKELYDLGKARKHSGFWVLSLEEELQQLTNSGSGWQSYQEFEKSANESISKVMLGGTTVMDTGNNRSQTEEHKDNFKLIVESYRIKIENILNDRLIKMLANLGMPINETDTFKFNNDKKPSLTELSDVVQKIGTFFDFDDKEMSEKFGFTLVKKKVVTTPSTFKK